LTLASSQGNVRIFTGPITHTSSTTFDNPVLSTAPVQFTTNTIVGATTIYANGYLITPSTVNAVNYAGGGLATCGSSSQAESYSSSTGQFGCTTITASGIGALTGNQTITLSGQASGSGTTAIAVTLNPISLSTGVVGILPASNMVSTAAFINSTQTWTAGQTFTSMVTLSTSVADGTGSVGVSGQYLASGGPGANTAWTTLTGGGSVNPTGTITSNNIAKFTSSAGTSISSAAVGDIVNMFSGCSGTQYLGADGACHNAGGGGSPGGNPSQLQYNNAGSFGGVSNSTASADSISVDTITISSLSIVGIGGLTFTNATVGISDNANTYNVWESTGFSLAASSTTATATLSNFANFNFAIPANETWEYDCNIGVTGATGGSKYGINGPSGATVQARVFCPLASATAFTSSAITALNTASVACATAAATTWVEVMGTMTTSSTAGTWNFMRAEGTTGDTTTALAGSYCSAHRIL
jgi:collagen type VII alpha